MMRPIHPGLAPNVTSIDAHTALALLLKPQSFLKGNHTMQIETWFQNAYKEDAYAFASGRGALFAILHCIGIGKEDEVLVEGFTCVAVVDAILAIGAKPVYVDIQKDFTIDLEDVKKKKTTKTKVLILQHTFGIPSGNDAIVAFTKKNNIFLIEDMAHGVGIRNGKKLLGTDGIAAIFSFGRDKAFSCVSGGMAITNDKSLSKKLDAFQQKQEDSSQMWIFQNLFHMISFYYLILPLYDFLKIGKIILKTFQTIGLLAKPIDAQEVHHFQKYTAKLAPYLAKIALLQLRNMKRANEKRQEIVSRYNAVLNKQQRMPLLPLLRFPLLVENPTEIKTWMRINGVYVGDWYSNVIDPKGTKLSQVFYKNGSCPTAEFIAKHIVNLPTYPSLSVDDVQKIYTHIQNI